MKTVFLALAVALLLLPFLALADELPPGIPEEQASYSLSLAKGWAIASIPLAGQVKTKDNKCGDLTVYAYSAGAYQKKLLSQLSGGEGYWFKAASACTVSFTSDAYFSKDAFQRKLSAGWNLVGAPWRGASLSEIGSDCIIDAGPWAYSGDYTKTQYFEQGKGYWVKSRGYCTLRVALATPTPTPVATVSPVPTAIPSPLPFGRVSTDGRFHWGNGRAPFSLVVYSDFQCPYCALHAFSAEKQLIEAYAANGKIELYFKHFPLDSLHPDARAAANAFECVFQLSKDSAGKSAIAEKYYYLLFGANANESLSDDNFNKWAVDAGMSQPLFLACYNDKRFDRQVEIDRIEGVANGVSSVPAFYVVDNQGRIRESIVGVQTFERFKQILDKYVQ